MAAVRSHAVIDGASWWLCSFFAHGGHTLIGNGRVVNLRIDQVVDG